MNAAIVSPLSAGPPDASNESPAPLAGRNRAEFPKTSNTQSHSRPHAAKRAARTHVIAVSPHMRSDGTRAMCCASARRPYSMGRGRRSRCSAAQAGRHDLTSIR